MVAGMIERPGAREQVADAFAAYAAGVAAEADRVAGLLRAYRLAGVTMSRSVATVCIEEHEEALARLRAEALGVCGFDFGAARP